LVGAPQPSRRFKKKKPERDFKKPITRRKMVVSDAWDRMTTAQTEAGWESPNFSQSLLLQEVA